MTFNTKLVDKVAREGAAPLAQPVQALLDLIESDPKIYANANRMISEIPPKYRKDPSGGPRLTDYKQMCALINAAISEPPPYNETELVASPINAVLDWCMGTPAGTDWFLDDKVNEAFMEILKYWGKYLSSKESLIAFEPSDQGGGNWMCEDAQNNIHMSQFKQPDPDGLAWGYKSWNSWFIREFKDGERPIANPNDDSVIVSACESTPFALQHDVQLRSEFWLKGQPYSLHFMLNKDENAERFVGGTVYQAFLNAFNYHRWHSPVTGKIKSVELVPGTYYAASLAEGFDKGSPNLSQGYITNYAARAIILIEADNPDIGLMAFVSVGMSEISSNVVTVKENQKVKKGDQLGYFQFGGSTHCLIFAKGVISAWSDSAIPGPSAELVPLGSWLAKVGSSS